MQRKFQFAPCWQGDGGLAAQPRDTLPTQRASWNFRVNFASVRSPHSRTNRVVAELVAVMQLFSGSMLGLVAPPSALRVAVHPTWRRSDEVSRTYSPRMMANWDPVRFATTAAFFNAPPSPGELLKRVLTPPPVRPEGLLWSAERPELLEWGPLDDVVMGGVSRSTFVTP